MVSGVPGASGLPALKHVVLGSTQELGTATTHLRRMTADLALEIIKKRVHVH